MDNLKIAIETIFVGVLALPWLILVVQLFFPAATDWRPKLPDFGGDQVRSAVLVVLVAAMGYCLGAAVSRLAEDFFNDDDLLISVTEDQIRASVYCDSNEPRLIVPFAPFQGSFVGCSAVFRYWFPRHDRSPQARNQIREIFQVQESALLLAGDDKTSRLRLRHQQILILRGATYDGVLTCMLCLLAWNVQLQRWGRWRWALPVIIILAVLGMLFLHFSTGDSSTELPTEMQSAQAHPRASYFQAYEPDDPPFMELTLLLLGFGGCYLVRKDTPGSWRYGTAFLAAVLPTALFYAGWYWTEIQYDRLVLYSFYAQSQGLLKPGP